MKGPRKSCIFMFFINRKIVHHKKYSKEMYLLVDLQYIQFLNIISLTGINGFIQGVPKNMGIK